MTYFLSSTDKHMKEKLLRLVDCGFFDHIPLPKVDSQEKTETLKVDPPRPCGLSSKISFDFNFKCVSKQPWNYLNVLLYFCILALLKLSSKEVPSKEVKTSDISITSHQVFNAVKCVCKSVTSE